jgi:cardiolipin synthase
MNLPNALSLMRIFLVAPFLTALIYHRYGLALALLAVAGGSDWLDGYLARRLDQRSALGALLDPVGDRLLTTTAFIALAAQGLIPAWLAVTVVAKDLYVGLGAGLLYFSGHRFVAAASLWGKGATLLQLLTGALALLAALTPLSAPALDLLYAATGLVTVIACLDYVRQGLRLFEPSDRS